MAKIIPLSTMNQIEVKNLRLSKSMLQALQKAYDFEAAGTEYGPKDIKGSINFLIERDILGFENKGDQSMAWRISPYGWEVLRTLLDNGEIKEITAKENNYGQGTCY
jgi:hypothetical protein